MASTTERMKIYWYPTYRSVRAVWLVKEMSADDDFELIRHKLKGEDAAAHAAYKKAVHPQGTIPSLVIPGEPPLLESGAICMFLADKYGKCLPEPKYKQDYYDFILYGNVTLDGLCDFFHQQWDLNWQHPEERVERMRDKLDSCLDYLSQRLEGREYLCSKFTAADCVLGYVIYYFSLMRDGELINKHPKILDYLARLQKRPAYQAAVTMT